VENFMKREKISTDNWENYHGDWSSSLLCGKPWNNYNSYPQCFPQ